jgi:hypothetical protein
MKRAGSGRRVTGTEWTCAGCGMTTSFMRGVVQPTDLPANWDRMNGVIYCLSCLRARAGAAKADSRPLDTRSERRKANAEGRIEFELDRAPDRSDTRVARACGTSVAAVKTVRERIGAYPTRPV